MSATFTVDTERIAAAAVDVGHISGEIESQVAALMGRLTALQDAWQGSASAGFQGVMAQWRGTQSQVRESLDAINRTLQQAGVQYADTESANTAMFR
ncbi:WXG100 family type VII secretion target [Arsenicicoccus dermatophilus]|uniref:WXG100 family type VII secretion target n=1 Tax=Arsenicicoccus dermatophilus TaxID=1076331 RepID=UPI001F4CAA45|nr:WXG100 family type VII secretion target [Arsenicicoccus dermatophilus]MCH8612049.1 WXG100 family type VII secretion target [Arsenicicoccus dermatophilus]